MPGINNLEFDSINSPTPASCHPKPSCGFADGGKGSALAFRVFRPFRAVFVGVRYPMLLTRSMPGRRTPWFVNALLALFACSAAPKVL